MCSFGTTHLGPNNQNKQQANKDIYCIVKWEESYPRTSLFFQSYNVREVKRGFKRSITFCFILFCKYLLQISWLHCKLDTRWHFWLRLFTLAICNWFILLIIYINTKYYHTISKSKSIRVNLTLEASGACQLKGLLLRYLWLCK